MNKRNVLIVSERYLFRKAFCKLLDVLETEINCLEHDKGYGQLQSSDIPSSDGGLVLIDCGALPIDDVIGRLLHVLSLQAEASTAVVIDEQEDAVVDAAMSLGAVGVIVKASPPQVIIDSLSQILTGQRCRPAPVVSVASEDIPEPVRKQFSARRQKMLRAIMGGQSITATARQLGITPDKLVSEMRHVIAIVRGRDF